MNLSIQELDTRRGRFVAAMTEKHPDWDTALFVSKIHQYYFTGTMQDGVLLIFRNGEYAYFVRLSHERAQAESPLEVREMRSYRDMAVAGFSKLGKTYVEGSTIPYGMVERMKKYLEMDSVLDVDPVVKDVRAVKTAYEVQQIAHVGAQHGRLLTQIVPGLLKEGMSEADLVGAVFLEMTKLGYQGISRFAKYQTEIVTGQYGFGENSLFPTCFDGPGGQRGNCPGAPVAGDPDRRLKKGDLVFVDIGFGINGYHSDKTQIYMFGAKPGRELAGAHEMCMDIMARAADMLRPGMIPAEIYRSIITKMDEEQLQNFMGYGKRAVRFLGHGVGLVVDEMPVIAEGFTAPLEENMVIALEPKKGMPGAGVVGVEETFLVTKDGGKCLTGGPRAIMVV